MQAFEERAAGIRAWAMEAHGASAEVADRFAEYDRAFVMWHAAEIALTGEQIAAVQRVAARLIGAEYSFEAGR